MRLSSAALLLMLSINLPALAADITPSSKHNTPRGNLNNITINNRTTQNLAYKLVSNSPFPDYVYQVPVTESDVYHSKLFTKFTFVVGVCKKLGVTGCASYDTLSLQECTKNHLYNAETVKSIDVISLTSCTVTCLDGSTTSCVAQ